MKLGTPLQKAAYANTFIFSKIWYVAQTIKLEASVLKKITQKILNFIWAGQNERPVKALNFRPKEFGGLGLMCPATKAKSLLLKSMFKDYVAFGGLQEHIGNIYGHKNDFRNLLDFGVDFKNVKQIYEQLMNANLYRNGSLIPSREEKRAKVKWKAAWSNLQLVKAVTAQEKFFMFQVQQDILPVGSRMHRPGAEKRCLTVLENNRVCLEHNDRFHAMLTCQRYPVKDRSIIKHFVGFFGSTSY